MTIRAIDLQVLIPRVTEVGKVQQIADNQGALQQQQGADQWQKLAAARQQQVQKSPQNAGGKVNADADGKEKHQEENNKGSRRHEDEAEDSPDPIRGHTIDIKT
ncbi:hypothetical protein [Anaeroselena agilis]|uniref:Uncharacterized protein n=1 Tax=Anaeroselena agilis TaxID=3063788 RepID=A0ABU3NWX5_9FIRM|nr:hypothetical protein [Selenomonadales bacterium 4137-cl]